MEENEEINKHVKDIKTTIEKFIQTTGWITFISAALTIITYINCKGGINKPPECKTYIGTIAPLIVICASIIYEVYDVLISYFREKKGKVEGRAERENEIKTILRAKGMDDAIELIEGTTIKPSGGTTTNASKEENVEGTTIKPSKP